MGVPSKCADIARYNIIRLCLLFDKNEFEYILNLV